MNDFASSPAPDSRVIDRVYLRRARQLARRQTTETASTTAAVLVFRIGSEQYGIELSALAEVLPFRGCTSVPGVAPALLGVMNLRGDIRAVADLRRILEVPLKDDDSGYVVMLRQRDRAMGLRIDSIDEVRQIDAAQLVSAGGAAAVPGSRFVKALTADGVIVVDTNAVLASLGLAVAQPDRRNKE